MDVTAAVGFLGSLITIASGVKGFFTRLFCGRRYSFPKLTSKNGKVRGILKTFQGNMQSAYGNHIFSPEEITKIQTLVMGDSKFVQISEKEREYINDYIYRAIEAYNEAIRKSLDRDTQVLLDNQEHNFKEIKRELKNLADKDAEREQDVSVRKDPKPCQTLKKLGIAYPDDDVNTIFNRLKALPSNFREVLYTFVEKCYDTDLEMQAPIFDAFVKELGVNGIHALFEGPYSLLSSDEAEPHRYAIISIKYKDMWNLILEKVDRKMWRQFIIDVDFSLLD